MGFWNSLTGGLAGIATGGASWAVPGAILGKKAAETDPNDPANAQYQWGNRPDPYAGMPTAPTDVLGGVTQDKSGLNAFGAEALRKGPSAWAGLATQQQNQAEGDAYNRALGQSAARGQEAQDAMAMRGGLTAGAGERTAQATARNSLEAGQDVHRQGDANRLQIGINDEQNRISQLGQLPGMQLASSGFDLNKANLQNAFNQKGYETAGNIWGAGKQADAQDPRNPASPNYDDKKRWYNPFQW